MAKSESELPHELMNRFIDVANEMKNEGAGSHVISASLMSASGAHATYVAAGNEGGLNPSGVDKVVEAYRQQMNRVQDAKKAEQAELEKTAKS